MKFNFILLSLLVILFIIGCGKSINFYHFENLKEGEVEPVYYIEKSFFKPDKEYYFVFMRLSKENYQRFLKTPQFFHFSVNPTLSLTERSEIK